MGGAGQRFAFVTHNRHDFSMVNGNQKLPHPDLAGSDPQGSEQNGKARGAPLQLDLRTSIGGLGQEAVGFR